MNVFNLGAAAGVGVAALLLFLLAWGWAYRRRRLSVRAEQAGSATETAITIHRNKAEARITALETLQADLAARIDALVSARHEPEERLQALASQILGLIRDKNATFETALAGLDQLRARMRMLEQIGDLAETRELVDAMTTRLEGLQSAQATDMAVLQRRLAMLETPGPNPFSEISEQLTRLYAQKDDAIEAVLKRVGPLESRLAEIEGQLPTRDSALSQLEVCIGALQEVQNEHRDALSVLCTNTADAQALADGIAALRSQKMEVAQAFAARLEVLEKQVAQHDPQALLERFAERLDILKNVHATSEAALKDRLAMLETPRENPFAEISEQLTRLYKQKDATVETVFARLAPLEARLSDLETGLAELDLRQGLSVLHERLEDLDSRQISVAAMLRERIEQIAENQANTRSDFAALRAETISVDIIAQRLEGLHAQKDVLTEALMSRIRQIEEESAARDPKGVLDDFARRLEALQERMVVLENPGESPFSEISEQLTRLYAQKDATVETVFARLAPLEARLSDLETGLGRMTPQDQIDGLTARLDALNWVQDELADRLGSVRDAAGEMAAHALSSRLAPLQARLAEMEGALAAQDPRAALDRVSERLEALKERVAALESPGESPFAEISEQLTRLYAQKDATVETVFARLAPLEAKLSDLETGLGRMTPQDQFGGLTARLETLVEAQEATSERLAALGAKASGAVSMSEIRKELALAFAGRDANIDVLLKRLGPLEKRLAELEARPWDSDADEARAQAQEIAMQMIAARAAAEHTELFADRLALLEATLPRLSATQTILMQTLERKGSTTEMSGRIAAALHPAQPGETGRDGQGGLRASGEADHPDPSDDLGAIHAMPRVISLHQR